MYYNELAKIIRNVFNHYLKIKWSWCSSHKIKKGKKPILDNLLRLLIFYLKERTKMVLQIIVNMSEFLMISCYMLKFRILSEISGPKDKRSWKLFGSVHFFDQSPILKNQFSKLRDKICSGTIFRNSKLKWKMWFGQGNFLNPLPYNCPYENWLFIF